ncbi:hypothetical protein SARC_00841 [Sphaeroforma arctica JP610]|uniref:Uncharacterized protein n=1 Tax=Sphaeroforma arctica JP610 TaxID=667725 RepID=A0A0L0GDR9_9EUKA|nr:hypothetical protein SARC_00841 [Sphaeroforma arctica JP610]KNC87031.1 hypothetical protein SARC_00841 [Sphaeroforma arctica JP610]|eukprot:XP_014160933.1 hypothetical protein SARC_00841 [Sphaeroforma arctica JP610]
MGLQGTFTSGGLGFEVWPGAQVFATWLLEGELGIHVRNKDVLELGAGCGLAGVLTAIFAKSVVMTDGEVALTPTLEQNRSEAKMGAHMASVLQPALVLRWGGETPDLYTPVEADGVLVTGDLDRDRKLHFGSREADELGTYEVIIAADIIYHTGHIATAIVTDIIPRYLKLDGRFFLVIPPERDGSDDFLQAAREAEAQERISMTVERAPRHYIPQQFRDKLDAGVGFRLVTIQRRDK